MSEKYDFEDISYGVAGWDAILQSNMQRCETHIWSRRLVTLGEDVAKGKAVCFMATEKAYKAKAYGLFQPAIGIALEAGSTDEQIRIQREGTITHIDWTWVAGRPVYLDPSTPGELTQSRPERNVQMLGVAQSATQIFLEGNIAIDQYQTTTTSTTTSTTSTSSSTTTTTTTA